jgi:hypothetical protein
MQEHKYKMAHGGMRQEQHKEKADLRVRESERTVSTASGYARRNPRTTVAVQRSHHLHPLKADSAAGRAAEGKSAWSFLQDMALH